MRRTRRGQAGEKTDGPPKIGRGVKVISLSVERDVLKKVDAYAKRSGLKRDELLTRAPRGFLPA
jgi:hypothetical protein